MNNHHFRYFALIIAVSASLCFSNTLFAGIEWESIGKIPLKEIPLDIAISRDGTTAYILSANGINICSVKKNKVTETIPVKGEFSNIAISPDGENLFITDTKKNQVSIIRISQVYDIPIGKSPVIGKADATVNVFAFMDFQCPYCSRIHPVLEQLLDKYPSDVNLIIKQYPLRMHKSAKKAAQAALAAAEQNKYSEMTKELFKNYKKLNNETIQACAKNIGLDMQAFNKAYTSPTVNKIMEDDMKIGKTVKVRGVPAVFINGRLVKKRSIGYLSKIIDQELQKAKK